MVVATGSDLVLRTHAKSFYFASKFLPSGSRGPISDLYAFCRYVDDISDHLDPSQAREKLSVLRERVEHGLEPIVLTFEHWGIQRRWLLDLIDGALGDTQFKYFSSESDLDLYCYRVAGVVGLMMCPLIGVRDPQAWQHAVDLGSAMQLTNMARDVAEDAQRGRMYFPLEWLQDLALTSEEVMSGRGADQLVKRFLSKAEGLYRSGILGLPAIPMAQRGAIGVALNLYRGIGGALERQGFDPFVGRAYVSKLRKILLAFDGLALAYLSFYRGKKNEVNAHNLTWRFYGASSGLLCAEGQDNRGEGSPSF